MEHHNRQGPPIPQGPPAQVPAGPPPQIDPISGALTLGAFGQQYAQRMARGPHNKLAVWFVDIRNFRSINPKYGFAFGNQVLQIMVGSIREHMSHGLPVARLGGDRFVVLTEDMDFEAAKVAFQRMSDTTNERVAAQGINHVLVPIGGVYYLRPCDIEEPSFQTPLDYASIAHRHARNETKETLLLFTDEDLERDIRRITIEQAIDEALIDGQIQVWYQPQVDYALGEIIGAEALARWHHPDLGWISPAEFIPVLENCGRIHDLDLFVWEEACRNAGRWHIVADGKPVPISVNVSRNEMFEPGLMEHFLELQRKYDLPKGSLRLEVTESAFVEEAGRLYEVIARMRANDMMVEMDDFGSGLSSLNMLKDVPVDVVKLDMGFMRSAMNEHRGGVVLGSVIRMLQGLDTPIIAEGVETLEQAEMLKNMGCHLMQGYHFSRPMPLADFENFIASNRAVEHTDARVRTDAHLDELTSVGAASSYLFNHVMGPTVFFFANEGTSESILVNDAFYVACGLDRNAFGNRKINPIAEIEPSSRATMWRAAAEAREHGVAVCHAEVRLTQRWFDGIIRYLGTSTRGDFYSLNIIHSGRVSESHSRLQLMQDLAWDIDMLDAIVPNGFVKCHVGRGSEKSLDIRYLSPLICSETGLSESDFIRRFHNSLEEFVVPESRTELFEALDKSRRTGSSFSCEVSASYGYGAERRDVSILGRVVHDENREAWLYALIAFQGDPYVLSSNDQASSGTSVIPFDYHFDTDTLVIHAQQSAQGSHEVIIAQFAERLEDMPDSISRVSVAKVASMMRDIYHHPTSGFTDLKCSLRAEGELRWYHINFECDVDDEGNALVVHGYAQDANDQMGSVRWWRQQAEIDQLTGLLNRNAVEQSINLAIRAQGCGIMFMVDLDGFKQVNDEKGHLAGDKLLRDVAGALNRSFRDGDIVGRYGGDEFVAFMTFAGTNPKKLAERRAQVIMDSVSSVGASCSVGAAIATNRNTTFYDLLEMADGAMYSSKERGKGTYTIGNLNE